MTYQNLWAAAKLVLRGKLIPVNTYIIKEERSQINNIILHLRKLKKQEQTKLKARRREKVIKIKVKINKTDKRKTRENQHNQKLVI